MDGVQKNKECQKALFELFSHCCKGPSGEESGECRKAKSPSPGVKIVLTPANPAPPRVKIVRAPNHYSAAHRVSLLRHPHGGNTRSRTKTQAQTPRANTSRAIDFGEITPGCNLSAIGLRDGIAAKPGNAGGQIPQKWRSDSTPLTHENRSRTKTLLCGPQSIFTAPSPWWQYTFAHQTPNSHTQNQHQPRHRF